ncbi:MAG: GNAT family N-acetyltransferase [Legionellales bacterium]|nr:GNAT family N-acetyltransferase [Legionellales bacterium]
MKIEHTITPHNEDIHFLTQKINQEVSDKGAAYPFAFFIRDGAGEIIAGCNGSVIFGAIYTDQLWVRPGSRKQGLGQKLMEQVHDYGREVGCRMATCATMSFQNARAFYETLGYQADFERPGYVDDSTCIFLRKAL